MLNYKRLWNTVLYNNKKNKYGWTFDSSLGDNGGWVSSTEKVINGNFSNDTGWTKGAGWTIANGIASCDGTASVNTNIAVALISGAKYLCSIDIVEGTGGGIKFKLGTTLSAASNTSGTFEVIVTANGTALAFQSEATFDESVDNISVREINLL